MKTLISLLLLLSFTFCSQKRDTVQILPSDEIQMQYGKDNFYMPTLDAVINDSLQFKVFFDTGQPGKWIAASDSIRNELLGDNALVQIGKYKQQMRIDFFDSKHSIFNILGKNSIIAGWEFFDNKVIELAFDKQLIRVYESLPDVTGYSKTKITISPTSHLAIPIEVVLQGKTMQDTVFIDTGNNGYASFVTELVEKYGINTEEAYHGKAMTNVGLYSGFSLPVDTIKIGDLYVANPNMRVGFRPKTKNRQIGGLLGVKTWENFSVILDLINYDLYLKKN